jgi:FkbM family methyltransferase
MNKSLIRKYLSKKDLFFYNSTASRNRDAFDDIFRKTREKIITTSGGVLHLGAHVGQERDFYSKLKLKIMWVEANPKMYEILLQNLSDYSDQVALLALLGSTNKTGVKFYLSSNEYASSSIYKFGKEIGFSNLKMDDSIDLEMKRLDSLFSAETISTYPHWVLDVQGSELEVLKGAGKLLDCCYSLQVEVTSRDLYEGGANAQQVVDFLRANGFIALQEIEIGSHEDIFFIRVK